MSTLTPERERAPGSVGDPVPTAPVSAASPRVIVIRPGTPSTTTIGTGSPVSAHPHSHSLPHHLQRTGDRHSDRHESRPKPAPIRLTRRGRRAVGAGLTLAVLLAAFVTLQAGSALARVLRSSSQGDAIAQQSDPAIVNTAPNVRAYRDDVEVPGGNFVSPITHMELSARFGKRGQHWALRHTGLDFVANWGTSVRSATDGRIIKTAHHPALGNVIVIRYAAGITIWYCHLSSIKRHQGHVGAGTIIGRVGSTGNATGPHRDHLEGAVLSFIIRSRRYFISPVKTKLLSPNSWPDRAWSR